MAQNLNVDEKIHILESKFNRVQEDLNYIQDINDSIQDNMDVILAQGEEILARVVEIEDAIGVILDNIHGTGHNVIELTQIVDYLQILVTQHRKFGIGEYQFPKDI